MISTGTCTRGDLLLFHNDGVFIEVVDGVLKNSKMTISIWIPLSIAEARSCTSVISCVSHIILVPLLHHIADSHML